AKVATKIDAALQSLEDKNSNAPRENAAPAANGSAYAHSDRGTGNQRPAAEPRLCSQCHTQVKAGTRFCGACGAALAEPAGANVAAPLMVSAQVEHAQKVERSKSRRYICAPSDTPRLLTDVKGWLDAQGFDLQ